MKKILLSILLSASFLITLGQKNIKPGYIVDFSGKVINGYIDYQNWEFNPVSITFGTDPNVVETVYTVHQIKTFAVEGEHYESHILAVNTGPRETKDLDFSPEIKTRTDTAFVRLLIGGPKSLYFLSLKTGRENFYIGQKNGLELLMFQNYLKKTDDLNATVVMVSNNRYLGQLILYLQECSGIQQEMNTVKYNQPSLVRLFRNYYKCTGQKLDYDEPVVKRKPDFGGFAGLSMTSMKLNGGLVTNYSDVNFNTSLAVTAGVYYNIIIGRSLGRWSINNELQYASYNSTGKYSQVTSPNQYVNTLALRCFYN